MRVIAVWHGDVSDAVRFANSSSGTIGGLVSTVPDYYMPRALWGFYRVTDEEHARIINIPRLTYKDGL